MKAFLERSRLYRGSHGEYQVLRRVVQLCKHAGTRATDLGEYTCRVFASLHCVDLDYCTSNATQADASIL